MWRSTAYDDDDAHVFASEPATAGRFVGAGAQPQMSPLGRVYDRTDLMEDVEDGSVTVLAKPTPGPFRVGASDRRIVPGSRDDVGYVTLRPYAGFPLPIKPDVDYLTSTNDGPRHTTNGPVTAVPKLAIPERVKGVESRKPGMPSETQRIRWWDKFTLGRAVWSGRKVSQTRPLAAQDDLNPQPVRNPIPSPGGSRPDMAGTNMRPYPVTFRTPPEPWDTRNGYYVDSGE